MGNERILTKDGSHTLYVPHLDETYHSRHGAMQESMHVFIASGLIPIAKKFDAIRILELGFGTGLNALLTAIHQPQDTRIHYTTIEKYPVSTEDALALNFNTTPNQAQSDAIFKQLTEAAWNKPVAVTDHFTLEKIRGDFREVSFGVAHNLVYWDVFGCRAQPHLWEAPLFQKVYDAMDTGGCLVTYSSKGVVRRTMEAIGFEVEKLQGPPGKREMVRAWKK